MRLQLPGPYPTDTFLQAPSTCKRLGAQPSCLLSGSKGAA